MNKVMNIHGLNWMKEKQTAGCCEQGNEHSWTKLDEGRSKRRAVVNKVMNIQVL